MLISDETKKDLIGVFGGTFDPIHKGHIKIVDFLLDNLPFEEIRVVPCGLPSHRDFVASSEDRLKMAQIAFQEKKKIVVDSREVIQDGPSRSIETIESLTKELSEDVSLVWIMGEDAFSEIESWYRWQEFLDSTNLIIVSRLDPSSRNIETLDNRFSERFVDTFHEFHRNGYGNILHLPMSLINISSSLIRSRIQNKIPINDLVSKDVFEYIHEHKLYNE
tara:strand:+ start:14187 stop:14846 length:660 start_codon:yes stop_codon:yes gene_type:complete